MSDHTNHRRIVAHSVDDATIAHTQGQLRKDLVKLMPGYNWTLRKPNTRGVLEATGIRSSGFNRLSTVSVARAERDGQVAYTVKSAGYGTRSPWQHECTAATLPRAFRQLQTHYQQKAALYLGLANALQTGREAAE